MATISFYREECATHGSTVDECDDDCVLTEKEYEVSASVSKYVPAKISGPPENCYPAEGGEVEIDSITLNGKDVDLEDFSPKEIEKMEEQLFEAAQDDADDYDCEPDDDYDDGPPDSFDPPDRDDY